MKLLSFIPNENIMSSFRDSWREVDKYVKNLGLDGIETMIGSFHPPSYLEGADVRGLHLLYFPTWLDLWRGDLPALEKNFGSLERVERYFGGTTREVLIDHYKKEFENARTLGVEYMVFHVSHVNPRDIFTFDFSYTSMEVIEAAVELINEVFTGEGPALLLENLFWPGLDLHSNSETAHLLESINYENKGLLLDMSHLICARGDITTYDQGALHILDKLQEMGPLVEHIRGIHLNASTPGTYLSRDFSSQLKEWEEADTLDRYHIEGAHIKNIDTHSVFETRLLRDILERIPYEFITLELVYSSLEDLREKVAAQLKYMD